MAKERDLAFDTEETWIIVFALRDAAGQPLDLTGASVEWKVTADGEQDPTLSVTTANHISVTDAEAGEGTVSIAPDDHSAAAAGEYTHKLIATLADETVTVQVRGRLTVEP